MGIYTRTGDNGDTSLMGKSRHLKSEEIFAVLGTLDELNASLGLIPENRKSKISRNLQIIQSDLFELGALLAQNSPKKTNPEEFAQKTYAIEKTIDDIENKLPALKNFILPGGTLVASRLHYSRAICRRLEREFVAFALTSEGKKFADLLKYINRLSDLLFIFARYSNHQKGVKDKIWKSVS